MATNVNLEEVARLSGVSQATASRALNGKDGVAEEVRFRVRLVAKQLGYRPNPAAQSLAGGRSSVIGLLATRDLFQDPYSIALIQAMAKATDHYDQGLMLLRTKDSPDSAMRNLLRDGLVDGVVVAGTVADEPWVPNLLDSSIKTVLLGSSPARRVPQINVENKESSARLVDYLLGGGRRRVATITGPLARPDASARLEGFRLAHERRGVAVNESLIVHGDFTYATAYRLAAELLEQRPDAVVAANDATALAVARCATEQGLSTPEDFCLVGFDGTAMNLPGALNLTTMIQPFDELAMMAVKTLIDLLNDEPVPAEQSLNPVVHYGPSSLPPG